MSLLTKIFIILVCLVALVALGVQATLFAHRVDFKAKWVQELNYHYKTIGVKNSEIAYHKFETANRGEFIQALQRQIDILKHENAVQATRIADLDRDKTELLIKVEKLTADIHAFSQNLEAQIVQIKEKENLIKAQLERIAKLSQEKNVAQTELQAVKHELEKTVKDLAALEKRHMDTVKTKRRLQEQLEEIERRLGGLIAFGPPLKAVDAKVMQVAPQVGILVINQGRDHGVTQGMKFTVYRQDKFVAVATVREAQRDWAALQIDFKVLDPQIGDDATNHMLLSATNPPPGR